MVDSFPTRLLSCCTDEYAHTYDVSTYSVSSDRMSDSSSELRYLGSPYMHTHHTYMMQHANAVLRRADRRSGMLITIVGLLNVA